jgi:mannose/fructose/N-acetylgalactosamine-specific phosphotransferase system component IIC
MAWIVLGFVLLAIPATNMIGQAVLAAYAVVVAFRFQKEMYGGR